MRKKWLWFFILLFLGGGAFHLYQGSHQPIQGGIMGASSRAGHLLREGKFPPVEKTTHTEVVIVGGGISGLSAAWQLNRKGIHSFQILELEKQLGGNAQSGRNEVSAYPWGAHYVPLPGPAEVYVRQLFEELGVIQGYDKKGLPRYNELYLCSDPQERLYLNGTWQDGLLPQTGVTNEDRKQYKAFFTAMDYFRGAVGFDGKRAFCIPIDLSSQDPSFLKYDQISMAELLVQKGWTSPFLKWYVDYACKDDYGTHMEKVSAWAGIHYFASRIGRASNSAENSVLTWPEGNGWLVNRLVEKVGAYGRCNSLVYNVEKRDKEVWVDFYDLTTQKSERMICKAVIFSAPRFVASHVVKALRDHPPAYLPAFTYAPWMVANLTVDELQHSQGVAPAWDNVFFKSESLGYVTATHQNIERYPKTKTVLTYYYPLCEGEPTEERQKAIARSYKDWTDLILGDFKKVHPDIKEKLNELNVWIWGHGMIRPTVGFIWGKERKEVLKSTPPIFFAHSDMSGISIFEEAQYRGVKAADEVLKFLKSKGLKQSK